MHSAKVLRLQFLQNNFGIFQSQKPSRHLQVKTLERRHWCHFSVFIVNFLTYFTPCSSVSINDFKHVIGDWGRVIFKVTVSFCGEGS